ncbi:dihydrolipoyl dehydrogenase family protein [Halocalculus aciditolerans]|uniref:Pyridine nucleotide-disulfide oxidoreductase n=1 Tax=Halocalculus aciditolerans TaxID=1383812 RepID=A0A830FFR1_9EURY|nr:NAD(P)/FAD-dependent oxidoreductase [Halocalculus aciditolerans]GGL50491.1 pyridine nucleotide-disulfide oxidoreductase [Halocalculus aciditolerans]
MTHVVLIGAYGSAGSAVAEVLADAEGVELTMVDDGDPGGGLCILRGCMPSKEVLSAGEHKHQAEHDPRLNAAVAPDVDAIVERKDENTGRWAGYRRDAIHDLAERDGVEFIHDTARFVDAEESRSSTDRPETERHTVAVGDREIEADYVVVATGSSLNVPDLPGIEDVDYWDSARVLDATEFPDSGVVMGFGFVGLELAPYLAEVGDVDLTVIEHDERPLDDAPDRLGDDLLDCYREEYDIDVRTSVREEAVEETDEGVAVHLDDGSTVEADDLFLFTGRVPTLDGLGLEHTAVDPGEGWVAETMQARGDERVFAVGDVTGREQVLHVAKEEGYTAGRNILAHARGEELETYDPTVHRVVFSGLGTYPYARLGHTADAAREAGYDPIVVSRDASDDGVFEAKVVPRGGADLVVAQDGTVLGYQGLHYHADVMAKTMQVIVELGLDVRDLPSRAYHPTTPEILDGLFRDAVDELDA